MPDTQPKVTVDPLPTIAQDLFCQTCGYNLRGLTGNRCPECGGSLDGVRSLVPQIPWVNRKETGWFRAYWRTVWFVMVRQARFCDEMARPVSFRDCQSFRWVTVFMLAVPSALPLIAGYLMRKPMPHWNPPLLLAVMEGCPPIVYYALWLLYLVTATGVPGYFFHPREIPILQQNRAIALSYYACGPLVFLTLPILTCTAAILIGRITNELVSMALGVLTFTLPISAIAWWLDLIHLARRLVPQRPRRAVYLGVCVPILWFLLALAIFVLLPVIGGFLYVIVASLS